MKSVFKTHFLKKLNKEDIKLLKTYGLTSVHGRKASGVEFFEKVHEIVEKEYNSEKKDQISFSYCSYYIPKNTMGKINGFFLLDYTCEISLYHEPSRLLRWTKFDIQSNLNNPENRRLFHLTSRYYASEIVEHMEDYQYDYVLPVSHRLGLAAYIGSHVHNILKDKGIPATFNYQYVEPTREIKKQVCCSELERKKNISGALKMVKPIFDKKVLLIDDVFTTGSTLEEYNRLLVSQHNQVSASVMFRTAKIIDYKENTYNFELLNHAYVGFKDVKKGGYSMILPFDMFSQEIMPRFQGCDILPSPHLDNRNNYLLNNCLPVLGSCVLVALGVSVFLNR